MVVFFGLFLAAVGTASAKEYVGEENYFFDPPTNFLVNQPDWKPGTFNILPNLTLEDTWGFVDSKQYLPIDHRGYEEVMEACQEELTEDKGIPLYKYSNRGTMNYYENTPDFSAWNGHDLVPENAENYVRGSKFLNLDGTFKKSYPRKDIMFMRCEKKRTDLRDGEDGGWVVDRVGPMISTGGYDWWQFGWPNVGNFKEILKKYPEGVDVDLRGQYPVTADGRRIGHPPIHIHHMHTVPAPGVRMRNRMRGLCYTSYAGRKKEENCYNASLIFEQHGDYQCKYEDDGIDCLTVNDMRRIDQEVDIEGELNDVRPAGSEPITWYYQVAHRWRTKRMEEKPTSQMTVMAPSKFTIADQLHRSFTFDTPTHSEHMMWYTGHLWADGELVRNKLHAHNMVFQSSQWFQATPEDLGLHTDRFFPEKSWKPLGTQEIGFANNDALLQYVMDNLEESQRRYDQYCVRNENPSHEACKRPRPRMVCAAAYAAQRYEFGDSSFNFDRRPPTYCEPYTFKKGEPFTVTGFSRHLTEPTSPHNPKGYIPAFIPGHVSWHFWYHHTGWDRSFFGRIMCNQRGIFFSSSDNYRPHELVGVAMSSLAETGIPRTHTLRYIISYAVVIFFLTPVLYSLLVVRRKLIKKD